MRALKVDIEQAAAMPGILLVLAATDPAVAKLGGIPWECGRRCRPMPRVNDKRLDLALQQILARDVVRYVGEPVAFVVGESLAAAQAAAEVVSIGYEALPSVTAPDEAVADGAPILWPEFPTTSISLSREAIALRSMRHSPGPVTSPRSNCATTDWPQIR